MYPGAHARTQPTKPAIVMDDVIRTYADLDAASNRWAQLFRSRGLRANDHVALVMENRPEFLEIMWGALRSGVVLTPVNWHLTRDEMQYVVENCGAKLLIRSEAHMDTVAIDGADVVGVDGADGQPTTPISDETMGGDMIYSSGTTGRPKGGIRPRWDCHPGDVPRSALAFIELLGIRPNTTYLSPGAPLYHAAPLRFCVSVHQLGGTVVLLERFDAERALAAIDRHNVTHSQWVPTMFTRMLRLPDDVRNRYDLSSHEVAIHAAAPCPASVKEAMIEWWGPILTEYYGGSEGGALTCLTSQEWLSHRGSVGRARVGAIHITDADGNELPPGEVGTVRFEGGVPIRYHGDSEKTAAAYSPQGWPTVGDVGYLDAEGYLYLTDRKDFMIIAGGVNIYPQETEDVLVRHPAVADVAVVGVPNEEFGEEVKAVVEPVSWELAGDALASELLDFCRQHLATYKCPRSIDFEEALPRSDAGKLYKRRIRDRYWEGHDTRVV